VALRSRFDKEPGIDNKYYHLILLAKNNKGYKNLSKLVSLGFVDGYYYKPRIDREILEKYHEGLICLSACLAGEINQNLLNGREEEAERVALWHKGLFGEDYYIEIQNNGIQEQVLANQKLIKLARKLDIPVIGLVDTNCNPEDVDYAIPGNDDAIRAVKLIADVMANAVIEGRQGESFENAEEQDISEEATDMEQVVEETAE